MYFKNNMNMKIATKHDFNIEPLPDANVKIDLHISYSIKDKLKIIKGLVPEVMEDKWFIFFDEGVLNFHRSWTGYCVYRVYCCDEGNKFVLKYADVNRYKEQYKETDDEIDRQMISYLINVLLLKKTAKFPYSNGGEENPLKVWSSIGKAIFSVKPDDNLSTDFIRIIPVQRFVGCPAPIHRPYAFYADAESLGGRTIADCYSLVKGLGLPPMESGNKHCSPFIWNYADLKGNYDAPIASIKVKKKRNIIFEDLPLKMLEKNKYVVLRISRFDAIRDLDVFPATWRALSYIVSDPQRMGARQTGWDMDVAEYASARIHALFKEIQGGKDKGLLAMSESKESMGLNDLDRLPVKEEESKYYGYLSKDSFFTDKIVELFGLSSRCWHGCGYLGASGKPICRFFLLLNKMTPNIKVSVMKGKDFFDPARC